MSAAIRTENLRLAVVLPVLNEATYLATLVQDLTAELERTRSDWRIQFVNDGSTDDSAEILDRMAAANDRIGVAHLSRNFGHSAAVRAGLDLTLDADAIVVMDSDGQDDPAAIHGFIKEWMSGKDVIYAVRFNRKESPAKRFLFSTFYKILSRCATIRIPRDAGNFGLIDSVVARQICSLQEYDRYLPGLRSWVGFQQSALPVERRERHDVHPRVSIWGLIALAKTALFSFSRVPLAAFYWLAVASALLSCATISFAIYHRLVTGNAIPGWASITSISAFFGAMNALGIAILGEYIVRIYDQVRGRPSYIVAKTVASRSYQAPLRSAIDGNLPFEKGEFEESTLHEINGLIQAYLSAENSTPEQTPVA